MLELPYPLWWESPSSFTFAFWAVLWLWGLRHLPLSEYRWVKRNRRLYRVVNGVMVVGYVVFIYDTLWIIGSLLRFGAWFPHDINSLLIRLVQNAGLWWICQSYIGPLFESGVLAWSTSTFDLLFIQVGYFVAWFMVAPDPSWTDWTYAIRFGPIENVVPAFLISHVLGKLIQGLIFISLFTKPIPTWRSRLTFNDRVEVHEFG